MKHILDSIKSFLSNTFEGLILVLIVLAHLLFYAALFVLLGLVLSGELGVFVQIISISIMIIFILHFIGAYY
jgi:uncharacterized RDD family membrane protein YckC